MRGDECVHRPSAGWLVARPELLAGHEHDVRCVGQLRDSRSIEKITADRDDAHFPQRALSAAIGPARYGDDPATVVHLPCGTSEHRAEARAHFPTGAQHDNITGTGAERRDGFRSGFGESVVEHGVGKNHNLA